MSIALHMTFQAYNSTSFTIEVMSASFGVEQTLNIGSQSTGAGAGKATFNPVSFTKGPDVHSAGLWLALCSGTAFQKVTLTAAAEAAKTPYFSFTMGLVALKTIEFSATESDGYPVETVTVEYGQCAYSFTPQNPNGSFGTAVASGWDHVKNVQEEPSKVGV